MKFDFQSFIFAKYAKWIPIVLIFFISLLIIYEYASLLFAPNYTQVTEITEKNPQNNSKKDRSQDILKTSMFGVYVPNDLEGAQVKKSTLDVTVVGIMFSTKPEDSQVIIRTANEEEKSYKVGDSIPGGAAIKRIMANGVLVEHDGALESLGLPVDELKFEPQAKPLEQEE